MTAVEWCGVRVRWGVVGEGVPLSPAEIERQIQEIQAKRKRVEVEEAPEKVRLVRGRRAGGWVVALIRMLSPRVLSL